MALEEVSDNSDLYSDESDDDIEASQPKEMRKVGYLLQSIGPIHDNDY